MRFYLRTSRHTGVSMPWPLALIVGAVWLVVMLGVLLYWLSAVAVMFAVRAGTRAWRRAHP